MEKYLSQIQKFTRFVSWRAIFLYRYNYSCILPSVEMVTTCQGINLPLACNARLVAFSKYGGIDRQELSDYLGVECCGLSAEISKLQKEGVLKSHRKQFALL